MNRWGPVAALAVAILALALILAGPASPASRAASDACTWQTNGETITIEGVSYVCHCERIAAIDEVWCTWIPVAAIEKARRAHKRLKRPAKLVVRLVLRPVTR